jgi:hypothetical protein
VVIMPSPALKKRNRIPVFSHCFELAADPTAAQDHRFEADPVARAAGLRAIPEIRWNKLIRGDVGISPCQRRRNTGIAPKKSETCERDQGNLRENGVA